MAQRIVDQLRERGDSAREEWASVVGQRHRGWRIAPAAGPTPGHAVRSYRLDDVSVVSCAAPRCAGIRDPGRESGQHDGSELGLLVLHGGRERVVAAGHALCLGAGDGLVWDTAQGGRFEVDSFVDKSTVFLPRALVSAWFPTGTDAVGWGVVPAELTLGIRSLLRALDQTPAPALDAQSGLALGSAIRELAYVTIAGLTPGPVTAGRDARTWERATAYIEDRIAAGPTAEGLAAELSMSVRAVYQLFADHGTTVRRHAKERRLLRARDDLRRTDRHETVAAVAHRWGFSDQSSFTKAFRARFGASPGAFARSGARGLKPAAVPPTVGAAAGDHFPAAGD